MPGPAGPPARLVLAAGRGRAGRAGRGRCLFTSGRGAPQPLPAQLPEVRLPVSVPAAPWIPATSSPAAGRGTWAECGEDPAAPEGCGGATPSEASRGRPPDGLALRHHHPAHRRAPVNRRLGAEAGGRPGNRGSPTDGGARGRGAGDLPRKVPACFLEERTATPRPRGDVGGEKRKFAL